MNITKRLLILLAGACALAIAASVLYTGASRGANTALTGTVGPGFSISLKDASGNSVTQLAPGTYDITVNDLSSVHNFHLSGPGVDQATDIEGTGTTTWTVTVVDGKYTFVCDAHPSQMHGFFWVPHPPPPPTVLKGSVGSGNTISLKKNGALVHKLKAGKYTVKVRDRSAKLNFHLKGPGVSKKTGVSFKGSKTWKLSLHSGKFVYKSDTRKHLKKTFSVT